MEQYIKNVKNICGKILITYNGEILEISSHITTGQWSYSFSKMNLNIMKGARQKSRVITNTSAIY